MTFNIAKENIRGKGFRMYKVTVSALPFSP
jgi:hypothetical protein